MRIKGSAIVYSLCAAGFASGCVQDDRPALGAGIYPPVTQTAPWDVEYQQTPQQVYVDQDQIAQLNARHAREDALYEQRRANEIALRQARALEEQNVILRREDRGEVRDRWEDSEE